MYFAYVDETGIDPASPAMIMVGVVANSDRLTRTQEELSAIFRTLGGITTGHLKELKSKTLFSGTGVWGDVPGEKRREIVSNLCDWLCERKHSLALAAIDKTCFKTHPSTGPELSSIWQAGAFHIALQLQRAHQTKTGNKGRTVLVFDDNKQETSNFSDLIFSPPSWSDDYYDRSPKKPRLDKLIDTPFAVKSHQVGLVQIADVFAAIFRRYADLSDFDREEKYVGEEQHYGDWVKVLSSQLLPCASRWPRRSHSECAKWYSAIAPNSLLELGK